MIDVKEAVQISKRHAAELLGGTSFTLEEIEKDSYKDRSVWSITLSMPRNLSGMNPVSALSFLDQIQYKRFLVDTVTGEVLGMIVREFAAR